MVSRRKIDVISQPMLGKSKVCLYRITDSGKWDKLLETSNLIMYTWAEVIAKAVGHGDSDFKLSAMYMEYENVASPGNTVVVPTYNRGGPLSYYTTLASPKDYLRVPLSSLPSITIETGYEPYFSAGQGNVMTFTAQTSGTTGVLTRPFSDANNSKVYGVALVATPTWSDATQDVLFARTYFSTGEQQLKEAGSQIGVTWSIPLL